MPRTFEPINAQEVDPKLDSTLSMPYCGAFMQDDAACGFQSLDDWTGAVACGLDNVDAFFDDNASVGMVVWWDERGEECEVDAERVGSERSAAANFGAEIFRSRLSESRELHNSDQGRLWWS